MTVNKKINKLINQICKIPSEYINYDTPCARHTIKTVYFNNINKSM